MVYGVATRGESRFASQYIHGHVRHTTRDDFPNISPSNEIYSSNISYRVDLRRIVISAGQSLSIQAKGATARSATIRPSPCSPGDRTIRSTLMPTWTDGT